jgi:hypothetical protein
MGLGWGLIEGEVAYKSVAPSRKSLDVLRSFSFVAERLSEFSNVGVESVIEIHKGRGISGPQPLPQFFACDKLPWPLQQDGQDLDRLALKLQLLAKLE